jgi:hypothetical protein
MKWEAMTLGEALSFVKDKEITDQLPRGWTAPGGHLIKDCLIQPFTDGTILIVEGRMVWIGTQEDTKFENKISIYEIQKDASGILYTVERFPSWESAKEYRDRYHKGSRIVEIVGIDKGRY